MIILDRIMGQIRINELLRGEGSAGIMLSRKQIIKDMEISLFRARCYPTFFEQISFNRYSRNLSGQTEILILSPDVYGSRGE